MYIAVLCYLAVVCGWWWWRGRGARGEPPALAGWWPLLGHARRLMADGPGLYKSLVNMSKECVEKGGVVTMYLGFNRVYGITDPEASVAVMAACLEKSLFMKFGQQFLGDGLITADVSRWHTSRRLLNPAFGPKVLASFTGVFNDQAELLVRAFRPLVGKPFDHEPILRTNSLATICATSFDVQDSECGEILQQYLPLLLEAVKKVNQRLQSFWLHSDFIYRLSGKKAEVDRIIQKLVLFSQMMVEKKKAEKRNAGNEDTDLEKPKIFLDLILQLAESTQSFSPRQVREEADTILLGGHETTANTLTFALALVGHHPPVQDKLHEEIVRVCGPGRRGRVEKQDLSRLVYTEAVLKETLRLYPIGLILPRHLHRDIQLKNYTLKAGSDCIVLTHELHRHGWPRADQFWPERWLQAAGPPERWPQAAGPPDPKHFAVFGLGKRACIGKGYAIMSMKISLAHVVRNFRVSADVSQLQPAFLLLTKPHAGHHITLEPR